MANASHRSQPMSWLAVGCLLILALVTLTGIDALSSRIRRRGKYGRLTPPLVPPGTDLPGDNWFTQVLDHSDPTNNNTWQQRYQVVTDYYVPGGPVFLMIGGEGEASPEWLVLGNFVNYAQQYNATMFQIEHRYYGKSQPTSDVSVDNLRYLTSEQALADIAYFAVGMSSLYDLPEGTKWIAFGGSYSGNLAAWVRARYPHLIHGAMSASGPVLAKLDFFEYMDVVEQSLSTYGKGKHCSKRIERSNKIMNNLMRNPLGRQVISYYFRLCDPIDNTTGTSDIQNLLETLAGNVGGIVQYNKDNRAFRSSTWNITIDDVCQIMMNSTLGDPLERYAGVNTMLLEAYDETCLDYKYDSMIQELQNTSWDSDGVTSGSRQWTYQTCTEFGYFQSSEKYRQLYKKDFPVSFFVQQCSDIFGDSFTEEVIENGVYRTNIIYGGIDLQATRVVYVHGTIDPWHVLGILNSTIAESPSIVINGTAHCANMYPPSDSDIPALTAARQEVGELIGQWLEED